jgi:hypothetical protein
MAILECKRCPQNSSERHNSILDSGESRSQLLYESSLVLRFANDFDQN